MCHRKLYIAANVNSENRGLSQKNSPEKYKTRGAHIEK